MKKIFLTIILFLGISISAFSQNGSFRNYYSHTPYMQAPDGAFRYGTYGFLNPAILGMVDRVESVFMLNDKNSGFDKPDLGYFMGDKGFGLGTIRYDFAGKSFWDTRISMGFGTKEFSLGLGYGFISGDNPYGYNTNYRIGAMYRPLPYISIGYMLTSTFNNENTEHVAELGIRPIKNYPLTFFADAVVDKYDDYKEVKWSAGASWEVLDGIRFNGRYFSDERMSLGLDISLGFTGLGMIASAPKSDQLGDATNSYAIRFSPLDRSILYDLVQKKDKVLKLSLIGNLESSSSLLSIIESGKTSQVNLMTILTKLDEIKKRKDVKAIVFNMTKFSADYESMWEIREKIAEVKATGKKIIVYSENYGIRDYHFASIADRIVIEPMGIVALEGFAMGRSYYKEFMDKYGIGFDEIRLFKYKSAVESFTRTSFSEGDKEQRQSLIDDNYEFARKEICEARKISEKEFDDIVDGDLILVAENAKTKKLVDYLHRWNQIDSLIIKWDEKSTIVEESWISFNTTPHDDKWGDQARKVAIVYAEGACDMETGIKGLELSKIMENVLTNDAYEAVILRVNSPGGSALASDYVAEVIRRHKNKKPVIVSQAAVAASGGYWLSMDADTILAAPMTITGSIGVISSWMYNKGLMDSLGIDFDLVKRGKHSDLGMPITLPFIPIGLPVRKFTSDEMKNFEGMILHSYGDFVRKVATGRGTDSAKIGAVAQGRVYSGTKGKEIGLVDEIGGLSKALDIVKDRIKFKKNDELVIHEFKPKADFSLGSLFANFATKSIKLSEKDLMLRLIEEDIKIRLENNGKPLYILPNDYYNFLK